MPAYKRYKATPASTRRSWAKAWKEARSTKTDNPFSGIWYKHERAQHRMRQWARRYAQVRGWKLA